MPVKIHIAYCRQHAEFKLFSLFASSDSVVLLRNHIQIYLKYRVNFEPWSYNDEKKTFFIIQRTLRAL